MPTDINKFNLLGFLGANWFLSLVISIPIILFLPQPKKYKAEIVDKNQRTFSFYDDLDSDGNSEKIEFPVYTPLKNVPGLIVKKDGKFFYQWIITGNIANGVTHLIGDYDHNRLKEIYLFTIENDSLFLNGAEPYSDRVIMRKKHITNFIKYQNNIEFSISSCLMTDITGDGYGEVIMFFYSGFSFKNRKIIAYDIKNDSSLISPKSGSVIISNITEFDWDNDGLAEFTGWCPVWGNCVEQSYPYSDSIAWLMVVDNDLTFMFEPIPIGRFSAETNVVPFNSGNEMEIAVLYSHNGLNDTSFIARYSNKGREIYRKKVFLENLYGAPRLESGSAENFENLYLITDKIEILDSSLNVVEVFDDIFPTMLNMNYDIDGDGGQEYIIYDDNTQQLVISREKFKHPVILETSNNSGNPIISIIKSVGKKPLLALYAQPNNYIISYGRNPYFWYNWLLYTSVYPVMLLIIFTIGKIQKARLQQKYNNERRMLKLQLKAIKNQIDPHFTLNMVNTLGSLFARKEEDKAYEVFVKYARMLQTTLTSSENISISLAEELNYVRNYLNIQKFRLEERLSFEIVTDQKTDIENVSIPKMLIFTFVENSVKHGFAEYSLKGNIKINVRTLWDETEITVTDNGVGMEESKKSETPGTGRGLAILKEITDLFYKIEGVRIKYNLKTRFNNNNIPAGTVATITIAEKK